MTGRRKAERKKGQKTMNGKMGWKKENDEQCRRVKGRKE